METPSCRSDEITREVTVLNKRGLHLRFAGQIALLAMRFQAVVKLRKSNQSADARSALSMLTLEASCGSKLIIQAEGEEASAAVAEIGDFIETQTGYR